MQNKILHLERQAHHNIFQPRGWGGWDRPRQPQHDREQKVPHPLEANNVIKEYPFPWCKPCDLFHKQNTCLVSKEAIRLTSDSYNCRNIVTSKNILIIIELLYYISNPLLWIDHVGTYVWPNPLLWSDQTIFIWWYLRSWPLGFIKVVITTIGRSWPCLMET
jgi:hypothetical protein